MSVEFSYGDGFAGRSYHLNVNKDCYDLLGVTLGSKEDERAAREEAKKILTSLGHDPSIMDTIKCKWDGTL